jgi:hypothetical protein
LFHIDIDEDKKKYVEISLKKLTKQLKLEGKRHKKGGGGR